MTTEEERRKKRSLERYEAAVRVMVLLVLGAMATLVLLGAAVLATLLSDLLV